MSTTHPTYDDDLYSDEVHLDPLPYFKKLRDLGPAVWLSQHEAWAIPRYKEVKECLRNTDVFVSGQGISLNDKFNGILRGNAVASTARGEVDRSLSVVVRERLTWSVTG